MKAHVVVEIEVDDKDAMLCGMTCPYFASDEGTCALFLSSDRCRRSVEEVDGAVHGRCRKCLSATAAELRRRTA